MKLTLNLNTFQKEFIEPILRVIDDGKASIFYNKEKNCLYAQSQSKGNIILYNIYNPLSVEEPVERFNLNLIKFKSFLSCISDTTIVDFIIENNSISYKDGKTKFNIRLLEDNVINLPKFNIKKIEESITLKSFIITKDYLSILKTALAVSNESPKFYVFKENGNIYFFFGDKETKYNSDISVLVYPDFSEDFSEKIYNIDILKLLSFKEDVTFKIAENEIVLILETSTENSLLRYITTKLKK